MPPNGTFVSDALCACPSLHNLPSLMMGIPARPRRLQRDNDFDTENLKWLQ